MRARAVTAVEAGQRVIAERIAVILTEVAARVLLPDWHSESEANRDVKERFVKPELWPDRVNGRVKPQAGVSCGEREESSTFALIRALLQANLLSLQLQC